MSEPEVYVDDVNLHQDRICIPDIGQDPNDHRKHDHVPGERALTVDVRPIATDADAEAAFQRLVGKRVRLVEVEQ